MVRKRVVVHGRVQGVFFRDTCRRRALESGVTGWVRNAPDGSVEAVFEGEEGPVDALCAWCRRGPDYASVERVEVHDEPPRGERDFRIRY